MMSIRKFHTVPRIFSNYYFRNNYSKSFWPNDSSGLLQMTVHSIPYKYSEVFYCTTNKCWRCGIVVNNIFCDNCKTLQRVNKVDNYFELLGMDYTYDLDLRDLAKNYRSLQSVLHPDKFGSKPQDEKEISEEYSSLVNKAYSTLNNPVERGLYMLRLKGLTIGEGTTQLDPTFLISVMEINEEIDGESDRHTLTQHDSINKQKISQLIQELSAAFKSDNLTSAKAILTKLKYFINIDSKIKDIREKNGLLGPDGL